MIYLGDKPVGIGMYQGLPTYILGADYMFFRGGALDIPIPSDIPTKVVLNLPWCKRINSMFAQYIAGPRYNTPIEEAEITLGDFEISATSFSRRNTSLKKVTFTNGITLTGSYADFATGEKLESIIGPIGFSAVTTASSSASAFSTSALKDIEFIPNQIPYSATFNSDVLTDASILSIANGLSESVTGMTLTMTSTVKAKVQAMMGASSVPSGETYHVFTPNAGGTLSLADFITTVKGWTLA